ncbi:hypothetical protein PS3A_16370 [Pseudomonas sp. 3A(2025)]
MPVSAPVSTSVIPPVRVLTRAPVLAIEVSVSVGRLGATGVITGASLSVVTTSVAWAVPVENAVLPPLVVVSAVLRVPLVDAVPVVRSQARKVKPTFSLLALSGM